MPPPCLPCAEELAESNYYKLPRHKESPNLVPPTSFWADYLAHDHSAPFASSNFIRAHRTLSDCLLALAVIDLPFARPSLAPSYSGRALEVRISDEAAGSRGGQTQGGYDPRALVAFVKEVVPASSADRAQAGRLLVSQGLLRADDRFVTVRGERVLKYVDSGELLSKVSDTRDSTRSTFPYRMFFSSCRCLEQQTQC